MNCKELMNSLAAVLPTEILEKSCENGNEIYLEIKSTEIKTAAVYLSKEMNLPLVTMFAADERNMSGGFALYYTFADRENGILVVLKTTLAKGQEKFESVCTQIPAAAGYEREIHDMFGLFPEGHPDPKPLIFHGNWPDGNYPLRKDFDRCHKPKFVNKPMKYTKIEGDGVYEIPVGPVHAGIIEPGHFRFSVVGEPIINLEAQLSFVHKGIEKLFEECTVEKGFYLSERISGDETFANSLAYCQAVEKLAEVKIPERARYSRTFLAELERLVAHMGDLSGIPQDVAYIFAAGNFNMLRIWSYMLCDKLCGVRFLRSINAPGGLRKDFLWGKTEEAAEDLQKIEKELADTVKIIKGNSMFMDRVENTGILKHQVACDLNAVGPAARAAGVARDVRRNFPYAAYGETDFEIPEYSYGDVSCRMYVKIEEAFNAISIMRQCLKKLAALEKDGGEIRAAVPALPAGKRAFSMVESPRGEDIHFIMTDGEGRISRYKVRTASFCNWPAVCYAVAGNIVPDFPLINKSFNLSYAGNDL
ncbi:MAG: NADH-quinone oxidoreductase subunit C [Bacillota bacterium]|jgi:Ni,Fe-hydrogenase III large subunit/Ni,Fe-hydrogenase III component G